MIFSENRYTLFRIMRWALEMAYLLRLPGSPAAISAQAERRV
jgi:hypothetical protein